MLKQFEPKANLRIAIIGAGPSGLAAGHELIRKGFHNFQIFDKCGAVGGTWHNHTYPGLSCDVKAAGYTFSYGPNPDWQYTYASQREIETYLQRCAIDFGLMPHLRLNTEVVSTRYRADGTWKICTRAGDSYYVDVVLNAMGPLHTAAYPNISGRDSFEGASWHSTHWNHDVELNGKRIAVVGAAAAAIQIVPEVAKEASHVYVVQRTPSWIIPRGKKPLSPLYRALAKVRLLRKLLRWGHLLTLRATYKSFMEDSGLQKRAMEISKQHLRNSVKNPELLKALEPKLAFGCNRPLTSDNYYPALQRDNVTLVASGASEIQPGSIIVEDGRTLDVDIIIYCTGYKVMDFDRIETIGPDGVCMGEKLRAEPEAYNGIAVPGFPNYFHVVGPNASLSSTSYMDAAEAGAKIIVRLLEQKQALGARTISVKPAAHKRHNDWIREARKAYSWALESCSSYYRSANGATPFLFPGNFKTYVKQHAAVGIEDFDVTLG